MTKLFTLLFLLFLILQANVECTASSVPSAASKLLQMGLGVMGHFSSLFSLVGFFTDIFSDEQDDPNDNNFQKLVVLQAGVRYNTHLLLEIIDEAPQIIDYAEQKAAVSHHLMSLNNIFHEAVIEIDGRREYPDLVDTPDPLYRDKWAMKFARLDASIWGVYDFLLPDSSLSYLIERFLTNVKKYGSSCKLGLSEWQVYSLLLLELKIATAKYIYTSSLIYDFVEGSGSHTNRRNIIKKEWLQRYALAVKHYKTIMATASTEIYACDNVAESAYVEIPIYTRVFIPDEGYAPYCRGNFAKYCNVARACKHEPSDHSDCLDFPATSRGLELCESPTWSAPKRYTEIAEKQIQCPGDRWMDITGGSRGCLCRVHDYYININAVKADPGYVVTGAKLQLEEAQDGARILHIKIEQGMLLEQKTINQSSVHWKDIETPPRDSLHLVKNHLQAQLGTIIFSKGTILNGLRFLVIENTEDDHSQSYDRIVLYAYDNGEEPGVSRGESIVSHNRHEDEDYPPEYKLDPESALPPKGGERNTPVSKQGQYVQFITSSFSVDHAQSFMPFIDTQEVAPKIRVPLGGAGLFLRGQEKAGGFIALKLLAADLSNSIPDEL